MVFGLCPAGTEFYDFTKTSFDLLRAGVVFYRNMGSEAWNDFLGLFLILTTMSSQGLLQDGPEGSRFFQTFF